MGQCWGITTREASSRRGGRRYRARYRFNVPDVALGSGVSSGSSVASSETKETNDDHKDWRLMLANTDSKMEGTMIELTQKKHEPSSIFRGFKARVRNLVHRNVGRVTNAEIRIYEGTTIMLAQFQTFTQKLENDHPYRFFISMLVSSAAFFLQHYFLDIIPIMERHRLLPDGQGSNSNLNQKITAEMIWEDKAMLKENKRKAKSKMSEVSGTASRFTADRSHASSYSGSDNESGQNYYFRTYNNGLGAEFDRHLLNNYGYEQFKVHGGCSQNMNKLIKLYFTAGRLGESTAKEVNEILGPRSTKDAMLLLQLKSRPIANIEPSVIQSQRQVIAKEEASDDFPELIATIIDIIRHFMMTQNLDHPDTTWKNVIRKVQDYAFSEQKTDNVKLSKEILRCITDMEAMSIHFDLAEDSCVSRWLEGEIKWSDVQRETQAGITVSEHDDSAMGDKLEALMLTLLLNYIKEN